MYIEEIRKVHILTDDRERAYYGLKFVHITENGDEITIHLGEKRGDDET